MDTNQDLYDGGGFDPARACDQECGPDKSDYPEAVEPAVGRWDRGCAPGGLKEYMTKSIQVPSTLQAGGHCSDAWRCPRSVDYI